MQVMREKTQGIIAGVIVVIIALSFALWGIQNYLRDSGADQVVAKVDGEKVTARQLNVVYEREKRMQILTSGPNFNFDQQAQAKLKEKSLNQLVKKIAFSNYLKKAGFGVGNQQLNLAVSELPIFQVGGQFSSFKLQQFLSNFGYSEAAFADELERSIIQSQIEKGIAETNFVLPHEIKLFQKLQNQKRSFGFFLISPQSFIKSIKVSDGEIQAYYNSHKEEFLSPEKISIEYIELSATNLKNAIKYSPEELKKYYEEHVGSFSVVKNGKAIKAQSYDQVASKVKQIYEREKLMQAFSEVNDKLSDLTYTNSDSLMPAAKELGLEIKKTALFTQSGEKSGILANPKIIKAAFSDTVIKQNYNSNPIEIASGDVIVLRVKEHIPQTTLPIEKVNQEITQKLLASLAKKRAEDLAKEIKSQFEQGISLDSISKKYHLEWHQIDKVMASNTNVNSDILKTVFLLNSENDKKSFGDVDLGTQGNAVVQLRNVTTEEISAINPAVEQDVKKRLDSGFGQYDYTQLTDKIVKNAKIKIEKLSDSNTLSNDSNSSDE